MANPSRLNKREDQLDKDISTESLPGTPVFPPDYITIMHTVASEEQHSTTTTKFPWLPYWPNPKICMFDYFKIKQKSKAIDKEPGIYEWRVIIRTKSGDKTNVIIRIKPLTFYVGKSYNIRKRLYEERLGTKICDAFTDLCAKVYTKANVFAEADDNFSKQYEFVFQVRFQLGCKLYANVTGDDSELPQAANALEEISTASASDCAKQTVKSVGEVKKWVEEADKIVEQAKNEFEKLMEEYKKIAISKYDDEEKRLNEEAMKIKTDLTALVKSAINKVKCAEMLAGQAEAYVSEATEFVVTAEKKLKTQSQIATDAREEENSEKTSSERHSMDAKASLTNIQNKVNRLVSEVAEIELLHKYDYIANSQYNTGRINCDTEVDKWLKSIEDALNLHVAPDKSKEEIEENRRQKLKIFLKEVATRNIDHGSVKEAIEKIIVELRNI